MSHCRTQTCRAAAALPGGCRQAGKARRAQLESNSHGSLAVSLVTSETFPGSERCRALLEVRGAVQRGCALVTCGRRDSVPRTRGLELQKLTSRGPGSCESGLKVSAASASVSPEPCLCSAKQPPSHRTLPRGLFLQARASSVSSLSGEDDADPAGFGLHPDSLTRA